MASQIIFISILIVTLGVFAYSLLRIFTYMGFTKATKLDRIPHRIKNTVVVALAQKKMFSLPWIGLAHALVFWGFLVILFGSIEMVIDGVTGMHRSLSFLGPLYDFFMASGDVFAYIVLFSIVVFLFRRLFMSIKRFYGVEMKKVSKQDANIALTFIGLLMISLMGLNIFYLLESQVQQTYIVGIYPISNTLAGYFPDLTAQQISFWYSFWWWAHILLIFVFANILPYSKHFHVFMSIPSVFVGKVDPLGRISTMEQITKEVKLMMDPDAPYEEPVEGETPERFGVKDVEDVTWVNYLQSLSCTECGRCSSVCPANITGKLLSPRKIMMDVRARMKEKGPGLKKEGLTFTDDRSLLRNHISEEELWACTLCNACVNECPIDINQPAIILDMRRYLVMEESAAPAEINTVYSNIENNGAPWQYAPEDRLLWTDKLMINEV